MKDFDKLQITIGEWSDSEFGKRNSAIGCLNHLLEEVEEIKNDPSDIVEFADAYMLLSDSARISGFTMSQVHDAVLDKLEINKKREWKLDVESGLIKHVKED